MGNLLGNYEFIYDRFGRKAFSHQSKYTTELATVCRWYLMLHKGKKYGDKESTIVKYLKAKKRFTFFFGRFYCSNHLNRLKRNIAESLFIK